MVGLLLSCFSINAFLYQKQQNRSLSFDEAMEKLISLAIADYCLRQLSEQEFQGCCLQ